MRICPDRTLSRTMLTCSAAAIGASMVLVTPIAAATPQRAAVPPVPGGTLNVLADTDTDYLDPNITYYSYGYSFAREFSRQLYSLPGAAGQTTKTVPDLATGRPTISNGGKVYRITIRTGAMWNTSPARQVTAADVARGVKTTCNPYTPFGGLADFEHLIVGMTKFCNGFFKIAPTATAIRNYMNSHNISGVHAAANDPLTVVFSLTHPAGFFTDMLILPAFSPRPVELESWAPGSAAEEQHTISDGPYQVSSYNPFKQIVYTRNPAWDSSTDPVRAAYVDKIVITETSDSHTAYTQMKNGNPKADAFLGGMTFADARKARAAHDPKLVIKAEIASNPFLTFNTRSPNSSKAMTHVKIRRAISYALNRSKLLADLGGKMFNLPLTHVLPSQLKGSKAFNDYPHSGSKAKHLLAAVGNKHPVLKFLYRYSSPSSASLFHTVQSELKSVGITVKGVAVSDVAYYTKYLFNPSAARHGKWDMTLQGWGPDWYGDAALSFFAPLYDGRVLPPLSSNFGLFNDSTVNHLIDSAQRASDGTASSRWHQADKRVMADAAVYPLTDPKQASYHASQVKNFVYMPVFQSGDFTNVWLDPTNNGG